jgi:hypothetical protein
VTRDESFDAQLLVDLGVPGLVQQRSDSAPGPIRDQQVIALGNDEWNVGSDRNPAGDWLLDLPKKTRRVDNVVADSMEPLQHVDEAGRVERVDGSLAIASAEPEELVIGQVKTVHRDVDGCGAQLGGHVAG